MQIIGITDGEPFDSRTWSGSSSYLFGAMRRRGILAAALSGEPGPWINRFHQAANCSLPLAAWKFRYHTDTRRYRAMTRKVERELAGVGASYSHVLQIYSHYNVPSLVAGREVVTCAYQDGNLARRLDSPFGRPPVSSRHLARAMAWEQEVFGALDHIFTFSGWLRESFINDYNIDPERVHVVGAGANLEPVETPPREYDGKTILFAGIHF